MTQKCFCFAKKKLILLSFLRGTRGFEVSVSRDRRRWSRVLIGTLPDIRRKRCRSQPGNIVFTFRPRIARYVRFSVRSYYGVGGGLQYFKIAGRPSCRRWRKRGKGRTLLDEIREMTDMEDKEAEQEETSEE